MNAADRCRECLELIEPLLPPEEIEADCLEYVIASLAAAHRED